MLNSIHLIIETCSLFIFSYVTMHTYSQLQI